MRERIIGVGIEEGEKNVEARIQKNSIANASIMHSSLRYDYVANPWSYLFSHRIGSRHPSWQNPRWRHPRWHCTLHPHPIPLNLWTLGHPRWLRIANLVPRLGILFGVWFGVWFGWEQVTESSWLIGVTKGQLLIHFFFSFLSCPFGQHLSLPFLDVRLPELACSSLG